MSKNEIESKTKLTKLLASAGLILVTEKSLGLPREIGGKPVRVVCLNRLWGIAL